ncbi:MAG TPA: hypothetical protein DG753_01135 [Clostridium sp.]|nr:hypothetical protein [Clostridium sp.]
MLIKRKNKGSSLIFVVIIFSSILIISTGMLSMVAGNYNGRVTENKRVENLYGSESGLDIAHNVVAKIIENANKYSYNEVDELKDKFADSGDKDKLINDAFREKFKEYINGHLKDNIQGTKGKYYSADLKDEFTVDYGGALIEFEANESESNNLKWVLKGEQGDDDKEYTEFNLISEFKSDSQDIGVSKVGTNERKIKVSYSIEVPNYEEVTFKRSRVKETIKDIPGITIGGNMKVEGSDLNIKGDVFVQGNDISDLAMENRTYKKYDSGIILDNSKSSQSNINFDNSVYTRQTFNIQNNVNVNVNGDLYAKNLYAGNPEDGSKTTNSKFKLSNDNNKLVLDNDLAIKANNTDITVRNFYGISDKTDEDSQKVRKSSSIIINNYKDDTCKLTIENEAYIAGVAHIDTDNSYQTGESVAVKGNYNAYSVPVDRSDNYPYDDTFDTSQSLQLINGDVEQKAKHFYEYWKDKLSGDNKVDCGGVVFNNIQNVHSIGAIVSDNGSKVYNANFDLENFESVLNEKREDYANKVYKMDFDNESKNHDLQDYDGTELNAVKVNDYIGFNQMDAKYEINKDDEKKDVIFSKNKSIVLKGSYKNENGQSIDNNDTEYDPNNYIVLDLTSNPDLQSVIICDKDVIIDGNVNLTGDIITNGNLIIKGNGKVNINYDKDVTNKIENSNTQMFKDLFGSKYVEDKAEENILYSNINSNSIDFIKTKSWKILQ